MSSTKLIIRNYTGCTNKDGSSIIWIRYTHKGRSTIFSTHERIPVGDWDYKRQEVRKQYRGFTSLNASIYKRKEELDNMVRELNFRGIEPTVDLVKYKTQQVKEKKENRPDFIPFIRQYI